MRYAGLVIVLFVCAAVVGLAQYSDQVAEALGLAAFSLFGLFHDETFPLLLAAGVLVAAGVLALAYGLLVVLPLRVALGRLRRAVNRYPDEVTFADDFDAIAARLKRSPLVGHAWSEFRETLVLPDQAGHVVQNTTRPHTFINYQTALDRSTALRLMPHIPNYFVGVGLLLTFVGLVAALNFANSTVGGDIDAAILGLQDLLAAATFKFWTSIAGLLSSIVLSFLFRLYGLSLESAFGRLCRALESKMLFATPQRTFFQVRDILRDQLAETKKINTEVAVSIADGIGRQMEDRFPALLAESLQPLVGVVQDSANRARDDASGNMEQMVDQFAQTLESSAGQHLKDVSVTLADLNRSLDQMHGSMNTSGDAFAQRMAEGAERLDGSMREVGEAMRQLVDSLRGEVGSAGSAFSKGLEDGLARLLAHSEAVSAQIALQSNQSAQAFRDQMGAGSERLQQSMDAIQASMRDVVGQLKADFGQAGAGLASNLEATLHRLNQQSEAISARIGQQSQDSATAFGQQLDAAAQRLESSAKAWQISSEAAAERIQTAFGSNADGIQSGLKRLGADLTTLGGQVQEHSTSLSTVSQQSRETAQAMALAAQSVRAGLKPYQDVAEQTAKAAETLDLTVGKIADRLDQALASAEAVSGSLSRVSETVTGTWDSYRERFEKVDEDLEQAFTRLQQHVAVQQAGVQEFVAKLDASLNGALQGLQGAVQSLESIVEDLTEESSRAA